MVSPGNIHQSTYLQENTITMATAQVLPKELRLAAPPTMPRARSYLYKQQSTQSSYGSGNTIQINLPRLQRSYLTKDSYLKFALTVSAKDYNGSKKTSVCLDTCGAYGLIDKIEVYDYLGSTLLESTSGHGQLMALLMDLSCDADDLSGHHNMVAGTFVTRSTGGIAEGTPNTTAANDYDTCRFINSTGAPLLTTAGDGATTSTYTREFALPLFSFLGLLSTKYAPLHNGYTINITLNSAAVAFGVCSMTATDTTTALQKTANAPANSSFTATVSDVYFCAQILELGGEAEALLASSTAGAPLIVPTKAYRNYVGAMDSGISSYRLDLNLNVASLTNILWIMRPTTYSNGWSRSLSERIRNYLQTWYFQYGSSVLPQTSGIQCRSKNTTTQYGPSGAYDASEAYIELLKSRHAWNRPNFQEMLTLRSYTQDKVDDNSFLQTPNSAQLCRFAAGLDLELVSGRSNDMICGMNTNGMNTSIYANFDSTHASDVVACKVDAWCEYDAFINVLPGIATTVSF